MISRVELRYRYPKLYEWIGFGFECGDGWLDLIDELSAKIVAIMPNAQASQVKEKWGALRVYMMSANAEIYDMLDWYEEKSKRTCEVCGNYGDFYNDKGWWKVRCVDCKLTEEK